MLDIGNDTLVISN